MKKLLLITTIAASMAYMGAAHANQDKKTTVIHGQKGVTYNSIGNNIYGSDGSISTKIGNNTYTSHSNGQTSTSMNIGNQTYTNGSNGSTQYTNQIGNTLYGSDGTTVNKIGNSTYGSNPQKPSKNTTCTTIGSLTYC